MAEKKNESGGKTGELQIVFPDELKKGVFSNNVYINHTSEEFILDFLALAPQTGSVVARVILTPSHTKRLAKALMLNVHKYEQLYGEVPDEIIEQS
jgi:hypothetical protein